MNKKIGRNEPCPCGSGKKYKRCCGEHEKSDFSLPKELQTGTILDNCMMLFQGIAMYAQQIIQFEDDGKELKEAEKYFEKRFRPGEDDGFPVSFFMTWLYFDFAFGRSTETVCERFLKSPYMEKFDEPARAIIENMSDSYCGFYEIKLISDNRIIFEELGSGIKWKVCRINEPFEKDAVPGDIWYLRLMGMPEEAYIYTPPFIFPKESKEMFSKALEIQKNDFYEYFGKRAAEEVMAEEILMRIYKVHTLFWAEYILRGSNVDEKGFEKTGARKLLNTDKEPIKFCKIFWKIKKQEGLAEKLSSLEDFKYNETPKEWVLYRKKRKNSTTLRSTILAVLRIEGEYIVGETNSVKRAQRLIGILEVECKSYITYDKTEYQDIHNLPSMSPERREKYEQEQKELRANPQVREMLKKTAEDYYYNEWVNLKTPALGNKKPIQAAKTAEGRRQLEALLKQFENMQDLDPDNPYKADMNVLREKLGLVYGKG